MEFFAATILFHWRASHHDDPGPVRGNAKKITLHAAEQARPDVAQARQDWTAKQPELPAARLIFLD